MLFANLHKRERERERERERWESSQAKNGAFQEIYSADFVIGKGEKAS